MHVRVTNMMTGVQSRYCAAWPLRAAWGDVCARALSWLESTRAAESSVLSSGALPCCRACLNGCVGVSLRQQQDLTDRFACLHILYYLCTYMRACGCEFLLEHACLWLIACMQVEAFPEAHAAVLLCLHN